jgi:transposase
MSTKDRIAEVARRAYWREADARVIVDAGRDSDETLARFAQRHGVHRGRVSRWAGRLGRVAPTPVRFHPVRVAGDGASQRGDASIEIALPSGRCIRVAPGFDAEDLRRVLAVVDEGVRC